MKKEHQQQVREGLLAIKNDRWISQESRLAGIMLELLGARSNSHRYKQALRDLRRWQKEIHERKTQKARA